jgi:hypothetical protein
MSSFNAFAQSSDLIVVSWDLLDQSGIVDSVTISQTPADGAQPVQTFSVGAVSGTTFFAPLKPSTPYTYTLYEIFTDSDGNQG